MKNELQRPDLRLTLGRYQIDIHKVGAHEFISCPRADHPDHNPSCQVNFDGDKETFKCYSCGVHGDVFDLIHFVTGKSIPEILSEHRNNIPFINFPKDNNPKKFLEREPKFEAMAKSFVDFVQGQQRVEARSTFVAAYPNYNLENELVQGFIRLQNPKGNKIFSQVLIMNNGMEGKKLKDQRNKAQNPVVEQLKAKAFAEKFQLYGVHHYFNLETKKKVLVVEGQKCVESLITKFGTDQDTEFLGIWSANSIKHFAWESLKGKEILLLPDNDKTDPKSNRNAGMDAMRKIETILSNLGVEVTVLKPLGEEPSGYDISDFLEDNPTLSWNEFKRILEPVTKLKATRSQEKIDRVNVESSAYEGEIPLLDPDYDRLSRWEWINQHEDDEEDRKKYVKKTVLDTLPNFKHMLRRYGVEIYKDVIKKEIVIARGDKTWGFGEIKSIMSLNNMSQKNLQDYVETLAENNERNLVLEWIDSKKWDGIPRFEILFKSIRFRNDFDSEHHNREAIKTWFMRALHVLTLENKIRPVREVLVFQSKERVGKTSFFRNLTRGLDTYKKSYVGEGLSLHVGNKDSEMTAISHWFVELGEMGSTFKKDIEALKAFISKNSDAIRPPYGRKTINFRRTSIFTGTVNDEEFLREGENTRYWVMPVTGFDFDTLNALYAEEGSMQQMWAELWQEYQTMGYEALDKKATEITELFKLTNQEFRPKSWLENSVPLYVEANLNPTKPLTGDEVIMGIAERMGVKIQPNRSLQMETARILKDLGIRKARIRNVRVWYCDIKGIDEQRRE